MPTLYVTPTVVRKTPYNVYGMGTTAPSPVNIFLSVAGNSVETDSMLFETPEMGTASWPGGTVTLAITFNPAGSYITFHKIKVYRVSSSGAVLQLLGSAFLNRSLMNTPLVAEFSATITSSTGNTTDKILVVISASCSGTPMGLSAMIGAPCTFPIVPVTGFIHLDIEPSGFKNASAGSGYYLTNKGGWYQRVTGTESPGSLILDGSDFKIKS